MNQRELKPNTAKLFKYDRSQAVHLPPEFCFKGTEVNIRRDPATGDVILSQRPQRTGSWDHFFVALAAVDPKELEGFMKDRDQGVHERDDPLA